MGVFLGNTGAVIFNFDPQCLILRAGGNANPRTAPFAGVVEHIAEDLHQIAVVAAIDNLRAYVYFALQVLVGIDLQHGIQGALHSAMKRDGSGECALARGRGALQVITHDLVHSIHMLIQRCLQIRILSGGGAPNERQRSF